MRRKTVLRSIIMALVVLLSASLVVSPGGAVATQANGYMYSTSAGNNASATITGYIGAGGAITIPAEIGGYPVTEIGQNAFHSVSSLTSVILPYGITTIGSGAFAYCDHMTSVTVPDSVLTIGNWAFAFCPVLISIDVYSKDPNYKTIDGVLYDKNMTTLIQCPGAWKGALEIPAGIVGIGSEAFAACSSLTSVTIPDTVISIGDFAFAKCNGLTMVALPKSMVYIGSGAFTYCSNLVAINIPGSISSWGDGTFFHCSSLKNVTIGDGVSSISDSTFDYCTSLTAVKMPESVTSLGVGAFYHCSSLTSIVIPRNVTSIANQTFDNCSSLNQVTFLGDAPAVGTDWATGCATNLTVHYQPGAVGFSTPTWNGIPANAGGNGDRSSGGRSLSNDGTVLALVAALGILALAVGFVLIRNGRRKA